MPPSRSESRNSNSSGSKYKLTSSSIESLDTLAGHQKSSFRMMSSSSSHSRHHSSSSSSDYLQQQQQHQPNSYSRKSSSSSSSSHSIYDANITDLDDYGYNSGCSSGKSRKTSSSSSSSNNYTFDSLHHNNMFTSSLDEDDSIFVSSHHHHNHHHHHNSSNLTHLNSTFHTRTSISRSLFKSRNNSNHSSKSRLSSCGSEDDYDITLSSSPSSSSSSSSQQPQCNSRHLSYNSKFANDKLNSYKLHDKMKWNFDFDHNRPLDNSTIGGDNGGARYQWKSSSMNHL